MTPEVKQRIEQIQQGNMPEGYKKTKAGISPTEWPICKIADFATIRQGFTFSRTHQGNSSGNWNYFKVADIGLETNGKYLTKALNTISDEIMHQIGCIPFKAGSIVFPRVGAALLNNNKKLLTQDSIVDDNVLVLSVTNTDACVNEFVYYALQTTRLEEWCNSGLVPVINSKTVYNHMLHLPPVREQEQIVKVLTTHDKIIELKEKRLAEKQRQKKHLMQQLLTGKKRLPGFDGEWGSVRAATVFRNVTDKKHDGTLEVLSATQDRGIIPRSQVDIDIKYAEESLTGYKKVTKGNFVISLRSFQGGIEYSEYTGIVSPAYTVLAAIQPIVDEYYKQFFKSADYINRLNIAVYGIRDGKQISYEDFGRIKIPYPPLAEQQAIADVLVCADREIDMLQQDVQQEQQKKKALMQLLLTGIVRVRNGH